MLSKSLLNLAVCTYWDPNFVAAFVRYVLLNVQCRGIYVCKYPHPEDAAQGRGVVYTQAL